ncbi:hypothetical protein CMV_005265 [Castanea mollissima]|uniref:Uncharacterized protein n=1 Tax=Castanea mollissima TaxID=60419 RepID=A0A8J4RKB7_9ROSI|nr:hypothetical protein CMV_005265 [Castanea mollissima]
MYPFAFMLACAGYLLTMVADCVVSSVFTSDKRVGDLELHEANFELRWYSQEQKEKKVGVGGENLMPMEVELGKETAQKMWDFTITESSEIRAHSFQVHHSLAPAGSVGDSILLIVALCFHSVFEGIAIGVAETKDDAWKALWTISLHKIFAAIAMGIALLRMIPNRPFLSCAAYAFAFAISSPIGVTIGIIIDATTQGAVADWIFL